MMAFALGCVVFLFWLSMTIQYDMHATGEPRGRPVLAAFAGVIAWVVASFGSWGVGLVLVFLGYSAYLYHDLRKAVRRRRLEQAPLPSEAVALPVPADPQAIEAARRRSLAAMKRASEARRKDKEARNEHAAAPLAGWSPAGVSASHLAEIEFDYVDARGKRSHRRVDVNAVDGEYLEGFCHEALATRTFVIGRVRGQVTDVSTGEMLPAKKWAALARRDPLNGEVTMDGERKRADEDEDDGSDTEPSEVAIEILFTGFPKAQRAELEELADLRGWKVVKSVTVGLTYLCTGPNAGPAKIEQAGDVGADVIDLGEFLDMSGD